VNGETKVETAKNVYRGTSNGLNGYWVENLTKSFKYYEDPVKVAIRNAAQAVLGHTPSDAEWSQWRVLAADSAADIIKNKADITSLYSSLLGRAPTAAEMLSALTRMMNGTSYSTIYNQVYASSATARVASIFPGMPISAAEAAKIANLSAATLNNIKPPAIPGESIYPAGLYGRDSATWRNLFNGGWSWTDRNALVTRALGGKTVPSRPYNADELMKFVGWESNGWWQNNNMTNLVASLGGVYQVISQGSRPKIAVTFKASPGATVQRGLLWGNNASYIVDLTYPGGLDQTVSYFMSEGARYLDMYKSFNSVGASAAAAEAKSRAEEVMAMLAGVVSDPLVLDLNGNGKIDVTGKSSAKLRTPENSAFVKTGSVKFDLFKSGQAVSTEWVKDGDALLVDDTDGMTSKMIASGKPLTGVNLFGDVDGYSGGFYKLTAMDNESKQASLDIQLSKGFGVLKGDELKDIKVWIDNGDGVATADEIKSLNELGITEIGLKPQMVKTANGETLEQSYFIRNGEKHLIQEVWFAHE
jgi:hypothetical protein